jgi:geranylgeranyl diphosphate synthase type I
MVLPTTAHRNAPNQASPVSFVSLIESFRQRLDDRLSAWFSDKAQTIGQFAPEAEELLHTLSDLVLSGGKRLRPALVYYTYRGCGGTEDESVFPLALATEFLHTYLLVHDDIMDHAELRRGRPAAHVRFRDLHREQGWRGDAEHYGKAVAILVGDLAHVYALEAFSRAAAGSPHQAELARSFFALEEEVIVGQHLEMRVALLKEVEERTLEEVLQLKSGRYSVERPIQLGALQAGTPPDQLAALSRYGAAVGEAFQLQDDVLGMFGDPDKVGKPVGGDLIEGKLTFLAHYALQMTAADERSLVEQALGNPDLSPEDIDRVCQVMRQCGALDRVRQLIGERLATAREALEQIDLEADSKPFFEGLIRYIGERDR